MNSGIVLNESSFSVSAFCHLGCINQSDFQSGVDKQKNQLTLDLIGQNLALFKAKSGKLPRLCKKGINKSSLIFPKNQFYLMKFCFE